MISIRGYNAVTDQPLLQKAEKHAYLDSTGSEAPGEKIEKHIAKLETLIAKDEYWIYTAEWEGTPAGIITLDTFGSTGLYIDNIYVLEHHRQKGIATALLSEAKQLTKAKKLQQLVLTVTKDNTAAVKLYQQLGYYIARYQMRLDI